MADLTWNDLASKLASGAIFVDTTKGLCISASLVTGDAIAALTAEGVAEFVYKLLKAANGAQESKNATLAIGSRLNVFDSPSLSSPVLNADGTYYTIARVSANCRIAFGDASVSGDIQ